MATGHPCFFISGDIHHVLWAAAGHVGKKDVSNRESGEERGKGIRVGIKARRGGSGN